MEMQGERKMETDEKEAITNKSVVMDVPIKVEVEDPEEQKIHVDSDNDGINENIPPFIWKTEQLADGSHKLVIEGISEDNDDDDEEYVEMTLEEIQEYLQQRIVKDMKDPNINPLLKLQKQKEELLQEAEEKAQEIARLERALNRIHRNQEKFLREMKIIPKVETKDAAVNVDLPLALDDEKLTSSSGTMAYRKEGNCFIKEDLLDAKVLTPSVGNSKLSAASAPSSSYASSAPSTSFTAASNPSTSSTAPVSNSSPPAKKVKKSDEDIECIDLTDDTPVVPAKPVTNPSSSSVLSLVKHPAPLPPKPFSTPNSGLPNVPPKPRLKIYSEERGIVLEWDMPPYYAQVAAYAKLSTFDIFGYQEQKDIVINTLLWKKIGSVKAMNLPMACTLTQFVEGQKYHFSVRAVDIHNRCGSYSDPISIVFKPHARRG